MGAGGSQEAEYTLKADVPAGTWHLIIDSIIIRPVDVTYDMIWRRGGTDMVLATWDEHWEPLPGVNFDAQPYERDVETPAIEWEPGDQFVWRFTARNTTESDAYIPNGDGTLSNGRIPNFTLPK